MGAGGVTRCHASINLNVPPAVRALSPNIVKSSSRPRVEASVLALDPAKRMNLKEFKVG